MSTRVSVSAGSTWSEVEKNTFEPSDETPSNATPVSVPVVPTETSRDVLNVAPAAPASARTAMQATANAGARRSVLAISLSPQLPSPAADASRTCGGAQAQAWA